MSSLVLKIIAAVTMLIDHIGYTFFPNEEWLRHIGRLAFPIFVFLTVEGFIHTRSFKKYALRLLVFAVITEIPFNLFVSGTILDSYNQNVLFTLLLGLLALYCLERVTQRQYLWLLGAIACVIIADVAGVDYGAYGVVLMMAMYLTRKNKLALVVAIVAVIALKSIYDHSSLLTQSMCAAFAVVPIALYNGKLGARLPKYSFYIFYPAHMLALYLIKVLLYGAV